MNWNRKSTDAPYDLLVYTRVCFLMKRFQPDKHRFPLHYPDFTFLGQRIFPPFPHRIFIIYKSTEN